jgi:hypothetical protein
VSYLERLKEAKERLGLCEIREEREISPFVCVNDKEGAPANEETKAKKAPPSARDCYAHPWPDVLPTLGPRQVGPFIGCDGCLGVGRSAGTWVRYGSVALCLSHALALAGEDGG